MAHWKYTVQQGDCISSIAFENGFSPDTLWNDPENKTLKQNRKDPNVLLPGDIVSIRDKEQRDQSCASEQCHRFKRKGVPEKLRMQFMDQEDHPRANVDYQLEIDGVLSENKTDKDGKVEIWIPPNAKEGTITFPDSGEKYELQLGVLDPITETTGVQARLNNLGFYFGPIDGTMNHETIEAIKQFQAENDIDFTGEPNEQTRNALNKSYNGQTTGL